MRVAVQYQRIVVLPINQGTIDVVLEDDLPDNNGLFDPKVAIFNTDAVGTVAASLKFSMEFGVTANINQTGTYEYTLLESEWPLPHISGGAVLVGIEQSQPVPIQTRVSALMPFLQPNNPVKHTLTLSNSVDELVTRTIRLQISGWVDITQRQPINNFRTFD